MSFYRNFLTCVCAIGLFAVAAPASAQLSTYGQDFQDLLEAQPDPGNSSLEDDGWKVFAFVLFPGGGNYQYGPFPAPNKQGDGAAFSNVAAGEGGPAQGDQQLVVFSDYNNGNHFDGSGALLETSVFQERILAADDNGKTFKFSFDFKKGNLAGASEAFAFIKVIQDGGGFPTLFSATTDTTGLTEWAGDSLEITIEEEWAQGGAFLQIGFTTKASAGDPSGIFYDNILFSEVTANLANNGDFEAGNFVGWSLFPTDPCARRETLTGTVDPGTYEASKKVTLTEATADLGASGAPIEASAPTVVFSGGVAGETVGGLFIASNEGCDLQQTVEASDDPSRGDWTGRINNEAGPSGSLIKQANVGIGTVSAGDTVYISFDAKGNNLVGGSGIAEFFSEQAGGGASSSTVLGGGPFLVGPTNWETYTYSVTLGAVDVSGGVTLQLVASAGADASFVADVSFDNICISIEPDFCFDTNGGGGGDPVDIAVNGGFESGDFSPGWEALGAGTQQIVSEPAIGGFAANLSISEPAAAILKSPNLAPGQAAPSAAFTLSFKYQGTEAAGGTLFAKVISEGGDGQSGLLGPLLSAGDWTPESLSGNLGPNVTGVTIEFAAQCGTDASCDANYFIDDVVLETILIP